MLHMLKLMGEFCQIEIQNYFNLESIKLQEKEWKAKNCV